MKADKTVKVSMMTRENSDENYGENEAAKWIRVPYKSGEFNAVFILPLYDHQLDAAISSIFVPGNY